MELSGKQQEEGTPNTGPIGQAAVLWHRVLWSSVDSPCHGWPGGNNQLSATKNDLPAAISRILTEVSNKKIQILIK